MGRLERAGKFPRQPRRTMEAGTVAAADLPDAVPAQPPHRLVQLLAGTEPQVGAADDPVDLRNSRLLPRMVESIDDTGVAAAEEQHEPTRRGHNQRLVVGEDVGNTPLLVAEEARVSALEGRAP